MEQPAQFPLLALPDLCLLAVLQFCAANSQCSLFSVARAHSRLHQAAVAALRSINIDVRDQQQADSALLYLHRHGSHVNRLQLWGPLRKQLTLRQLPPSLHLHSLELSGRTVQLLPGKGFQGLLGGGVAAAAPPLKQLRLGDCNLLDGGEPLAAALLQLPALEVLGLWNLDEEVADGWGPTPVCFPTGVLEQLPQLIFLQLAGSGSEDCSASMLSGLCYLTSLALHGVVFEPGALAGKDKLQQLELISCDLQPHGGAGLAELLSQLQYQTQLTHLDLWGSVRADGESNPPAAAYSALTASSKLQHLGISTCKLPAGVWQHLFPTGRQLLQLTSLDLSEVWQLPNGAEAALERCRIVSCCPRLKSLNMYHLKYSPQQLTELQGLSGLHTLRLVTGTARGGVEADTGDTLQAVCQLTGLRELGLTVHQSINQCYTCSYEAQKAHASHSLISRK
jgi:hypothetical protein